VAAASFDVAVAPQTALGSLPSAARADLRERRVIWFELLTIDALTTGAVLCGSALLRLRGRLNEPHVVLLAALFVIPGAVTLLLACMITGTYRRARRELDPSAQLEVPAVIVSAGLAAAATIGIGAILPASYSELLRPPADILVTFLCCAGALPLARAAALAYDRRRGVVMARTVIVGTGLIAGDVAQRLWRSGRTEVVGYVDDDPETTNGYLGPLNQLAEVCARFNVDRVVVAFSRSHPSHMAGVLRALPPDVTVDVVPRYYELTGLQASLGDLSGMPIICLGSRGRSRASTTTKRAIDVAVSLAGLLVLSPVLLVTALAVRLSSPGPVFYRQARLGRERTPFRIIKFRTMYRSIETGGASPERRAVPSPLSERPDFDRVTRIGRLLRRTGIDELPQLFNVLRGEMSLVGPRPFIPEECSGLESWAEGRFEMCPGITGLWQVCGQHHLRLEELWQLDSQYVMTWSLGSDLKILARTPRRLIRGDRGSGAGQ
jgi:exopolysaccharide biosynthesis polyprenyl glycosylphosphotransferase